MGKLEGKVAVITGGASGIGEAAVRLFVEEGARVVVADILDEAGKAVAGALGENALYAHTDVTQEAEVQAAIDLAVGRFGRLDAIFNNAGAGKDLGGIEEISLVDFDFHLAVLLRGVFLGMKSATRVMKRQGSGSIINTGSVAGLQAGFGSHAYSAAKAAVIQLTRTVAMELGESGVRVNCICPGAITTPIFGRAFGLEGERLSRSLEIMKMALATMQPICRAGLPEDVAQAALWLASDESSFVNGHALVVDGGLIGGRRWSESQQRREMLRVAMRGLAAGR